MMSTAGLSHALHQHKVWIESNGAHGRHINLKNANLSGANLKGKDLRGAWLQGSDLTGADLSGARIGSVTLCPAYNRNITLPVKTNFFQANLSSANLSEASLENVTMKAANLMGADLSRSAINRVNLHGANISGANLNQAVINQSILVNANLSKSDLSQAIIIQGALLDANLSGADLTKSRLKQTNLEGASLKHTNLSQTKMIQCVCIDTDFAGAWFRNTEIQGTHMDPRSTLQVPQPAVNREGSLTDSKDSNSCTLVRSAIMPQEYHQACISLFSYAQTILHDKFPSSQVGARIKRKKKAVHLILSCPEEIPSQEVEDILKCYGKVIRGDLIPEDFLEDPLGIIGLKNQLLIAQKQLENTTTERCGKTFSHKPQDISSTPHIKQIGATF